MKEVSNFTELVRTILYDVVGLLIPGLFFLALLLVLVSCWKGNPPFQLIEKAANQSKITLEAGLLAAYGLGYFIESLWVLHSSFLLGLGQRLLGRQEPKKWPSIFGGANVATQLAKEGYESMPFYMHVRHMLGERAGFPNPDELGFTDVGSLSHSFAGAEADLARQFRFRGDLCGTISTMSLLVAVGMIPVLVLTNYYPWYWCLLPALLLLWIVVLGLPLFLEFKHCSENVLGTLRRVVLPLTLVAVMAFLACITNRPWPVLWAFPTFIAVWFMMLWRAYFYLNLGGRVHFGIALAVIVGQTMQDASSTISKPVAEPKMKVRVQDSKSDVQTGGAAKEIQKAEGEG